MLHYLIELAVWMLGSYFAGACLGCLLRKLFGADEPAMAVAAAATGPVMVPRTVAPAPVAAPMPVARPAPTPTPMPVAAPVAAVADVDTGKLERPKGISVARGGKADDLQRISGVGPKNEKVLHGLGFFHFDQIAAWTSSQVNWVDDHLRFNGRIKREEWIRQSRLLAEGKEAEFTKLYGTGGVRSRSGETLSGSRTRKL